VVTLLSSVMTVMRLPIPCTSSISTPGDREGDPVGISESGL